MKAILHLDKNSILEDFNFEHFYENEIGLLRRGSSSGWRVVNGLCPFHNDHKPGSLAVNVVHGGFICYSCGAKGSVIAFVKQTRGLNYRSALKALAEFSGRN